MTLRNNTLPEIRRGKLKAILKQGNLVRVMEAHNGLSGIIANNLKIEGQSDGQPVTREFDALWESSLTDSASKGYPDIEVVSFDSRLQTISEILAVTSKPLIVDGDTGGDPNNFEYAITRLENAGVSAVIIEDKVFPKRNSLEDGAQQTLETPKIFANKIRRGKQIQITDDFMIIARLESLIAGRSVEDALFRAREYLLAGADGIMIHSKSKEPGEIFDFAKKYRALLKELDLERPLVCVPTTYNKVTEDELAEAGFNVAIYANHLLRSAYRAMMKTGKNILIHQRSFEADPYCAPVRDIFKTVGFLDVKEKDKQDQTNTNIPVVIPAAGEEIRLKDVLNGKPKAMLDVAGKPLLHRQVALLNKNNLMDVTVVTGYGAEHVRAEGCSLVENKDYKKGTLLNSIFAARDKLEDGFVLLYSDILLESHIIAKLMACEEDIVLAVDDSIQYHKNESGHYIDFVASKKWNLPSRRKISFVYENDVARIGKKINSDNATHEFMGLAKFSKTGAERFIQTYQDCVQNYEGRLHEADDISKLSFTDLIQEMIDREFTVNFMEVHKGWIEVHYPEDIELASKLFKSENP